MRTYKGSILTRSLGGFGVRGLRFGVSVAMVAAGLAVSVAPAPAHDWNEDTVDDDVVVDNGLVRLGIHPQGHLNTCVSELTCPEGLQYVPNGNEATAPGCLCEGWGAAAADLNTSGFANEAVDGVVNLEVESFTSDGVTAQSVTLIREGGGGEGGGDGGGEFGPAGVDNVDNQTVSPIRDGVGEPAATAVGDPLLRVTHDFHPSVHPNLYEVAVTIENVSSTDVADLRYRRVMDWDVEPTPFDEFVTIAGGADALLYSSNNGFESANPLGTRTDLGSVGPPTGAEFEDAGPADHGALFDFGFGELPAGGTTSFNIYYGAAGPGESDGRLTGEEQALEAVAAVGAEVYSLGQPNVGDEDANGLLDGPEEGNPNTFIFGFTGVGGAGEVGRDARPPIRLLVRQDPARLELPAVDGVIPFEVMSNTKNVGDGDAHGVETRIELGPNLALVGGDNPALIPGPDGDPVPDPGTLGPGEIGEHRWMLEATPQCEPVTSFFDVFVDYDERPVDETERMVHRVLTIPGTCGKLRGNVSEFGGGPLAGAEVSVCPSGGGACTVLTTDDAGNYDPFFPSGSYDLTARPPAGADPALVPVSFFDVFLDLGEVQPVNFVLGGPLPLPPDVTITGRDTGEGIPVLYWGEPNTVVKRGQCTGGLVRYEVRQGPDDNGDGLPDVLIQGAGMAEDPAGSGTYSAVIPPFFPDHGYADVFIFVDCPPHDVGDGFPDDPPAGDNIQRFTVYIDPSGFVREVDGTPISEATVTLLRSETPGGPFVPVPDGSDIMSPANRSNPDLTDAAGHFGWDVSAGYYKVRAEKEGCVDPVDPSKSFVETASLEIPPPVTDLDIRLDCEVPPPALTCAGFAVTIVGTMGNDTLRGTPGRDVIHGLEGNDTIRGLGGDDVLCGGPGNDRVHGNNGNDQAYGNEGNDRVHGDNGNDRVHGDNGNDQVHGDNGNDQVDGGTGADRIKGGRNVDDCDGGVDADTDRAASCETIANIP